jgi:hypothetical protein
VAIIHQATLTPTKPELVAAWLDAQPWAGSGETEVVGSYRFDDPDGEVGVEAMIVRRGERWLHVPMTYRGAPLDGGDAHLIGTLHHSVLGERWVYDAAADPVARACFVRAFQGEQEQAEMELWDGDRLLERRPTVVQVRRDHAGDDHGDHDAEVDASRLVLVRVIDGPVDAPDDGPDRLLATWPGSQGVVAALTPSCGRG